MFKKALIYILSVSLGIIIGIYVFFPSETVKDLINTNQKFLKARDLSLIFPFGVKLESVDVFVDGGKIVLSEVKISPSFTLIFTLPKGKASYNISAKSDEIDIKAFVSLINDRHLKLLEISGWLNPERIPVSKDFKATGTVAINVSLENLEDIEKTSGRIKAFTGGLTVEVKRSQFFEGELKLGKTELVADINSGNLRIIKLTTEKGDIWGSITGTIRLRENFVDSELNLQADLETKIINLPFRKFKITGTLRNPSVSPM